MTTIERYIMSREEEHRMVVYAPPRQPWTLTKRETDKPESAHPLTKVFLDFLLRCKVHVLVADVRELLRSFWAAPAGTVAALVKSLVDTMTTMCPSRDPREVAAAYVLAHNLALTSQPLPHGLRSILIDDALMSPPVDLRAFVAECSARGLGVIAAGFRSALGPGEDLEYTCSFGMARRAIQCATRGDPNVAFDKSPTVRIGRLHLRFQVHVLFADVMRSGKTSELLRLFWAAPPGTVALVKPLMDTRSTMCWSRDPRSVSAACVRVHSLAKLTSQPLPLGLRSIFIDETHMFAPADVRAFLAECSARGLNVVAAGIRSTFDTGEDLEYTRSFDVVLRAPPARRAVQCATCGDPNVAFDKFHPAAALLGEVLDYRHFVGDEQWTGECAGCMRFPTVRIGRAVTREDLEAAEQPATPPKPLLVVCGSTNPNKVSSVRRAFERSFPERDVKVVSVGVASGVSEQPSTDAETRRGAANRAENALQKLRSQSGEHAAVDFSVGIEGGVGPSASGSGDATALGGHFDCFSWVVVRHSKTGRCGFSRTASYPLPPVVCALLDEGLELGDADDRVFRRANSKQAGGAVGILTHGLIDRAACNESALALALIPFLNPGLF